MTSITIVLLILKALSLIPIDWWVCFIPTMIDVSVGLVVLLMYSILVWKSPFKL